MQDVAGRFGLEAKVQDDEIVLSAALDRDGRADLLKAMVEAGCAISEYRIRKMRLEDLFLSLMQGEATEVDA